MKISLKFPSLVQASIVDCIVVDLFTDIFPLNMEEFSKDENGKNIFRKFMKKSGKKSKSTESVLEVKKISFAFLC